MNVEAMFEALLKEIREMREGGPRLQSVYSKEDAARELAISVRTLNRMVADGLILTCARGNIRGAGVPRSEIERLSTPERKTPPAPLPPGGGHGKKRGRRPNAARTAKEEADSYRAKLRGR